MFLTLVVVNFDKSNEDNALHVANIKDISSTDSVLKLEISISFIFLHPLKIFSKI